MAGFVFGVGLLVLGIVLLSPTIHLDNGDGDVQNLENQSSSLPTNSPADAPPPPLASRSFDAAALSQMDATPKLVHAKARAISFQDSRLTLPLSHPVRKSPSKSKFTISSKCKSEQAGTRGAR